MRPAEFISRVLDLMDFGAITPDSFNSAALAISLQDGKMVLETNGYRIFIQSQMCLGHVIMVAEIRQENEFLVGASICFTFHQYDFEGQQPEEDQYFESWKLPERHLERIDRIMEVLTYLTLRTNHSIRDKISRS